MADLEQSADQMAEVVITSRSCSQLMADGMGSLRAEPSERPITAKSSREDAQGSGIGRVLSSCRRGGGE